MHIVLIFKLVGDEVMKIGQCPSRADLEKSVLKKDPKVLDEQNYSDLIRAIGLASHGIGAGSHVYLRRVFENLLE